VEAEHQVECIILVMIEMISAVIGIFVNLMIFSSVRNLDYLQESTSNLLITNICFSNILISFLVKPISAIYVSYALSTKEWHVGLAFCTLYTLTYRTTWLAFPLSMVSLCWNSLDTHCKKITCCRSYHHQHGTVAHLGGSLEEEGSITDDAELQAARRAMAFPTIKQKAMLTGIWFISFLYGLMACFPEKMLGEGEPHVSKPPLNTTNSTIPSIPRRNSDMVYCPVRSQPGDMLDNITMYLSIYIPTILGPVVSFGIFIISLPFSNICSEKLESCSFLLIPGLIIIHLGTYFTHLLLSETLHLDEFHFLIVKYCAGFSHIMLVPFLVISTRKDIRMGVRKTFNSSVLCSQKKMDPG